MEQKNNLDRVKEIAISFLYMSPDFYSEDITSVVIHPFFDERVVPFVQDDYIFKVLDIAKPEEFQEAAKIVKEQILKSENCFQVFYGLTRSHRLTFFKFTNEYLTEKEYAEILRFSYTDVDMPGLDRNVSKRELLSYFKKANKNFIMTKDEINLLNDLDEEVTIYRGVKEEKAVKNLSWTLSFEWACHFSRSPYFTGYVYKANIKKKDIICYFDGQQEIIVDYNKLYDIEKM